MGNDIVATTGRINAPGAGCVTGPDGQRAAARKRAVPGGKRRRSLVIASSAVAAMAVLAGCDSGQPARDNGTGSTPGTAGASQSAASVVAGTQCVTSAAKGTCGPYRYPDITNSDGQNTVVGQNVWNPISGWSQTLHATGPGKWSVTANMPQGNTAVVSFPNTGQEYYYTNTLAGFSKIYSSFSENMNPAKGTSAEAAYDVWLNNWNNEVMIQHDIVNRGTCPVRATASFGGSGGVPVQRWHLCVYGSELIWQLSGRGEKTGTVDVLAMLRWLADHGYVARKSSLTDISYGFEICSTGGRPETFQLSQFSIRSA
jgi:hypothetical protein